MGDLLPVALEDSQDVEAVANPYTPLLDEARSTLRQIMLNSKDNKIRVSTATEILDRGGETRKPSSVSSAPQILIKDSQVQLLVKAAKEAIE
jgi:hypothetical protein